MQIHSYLSPKCESRKSPLHGYGIFAKTKILYGEVIALWGGVVYSSEEVARLATQDPRFETHCVSIYKGFLLGPVNATNWKLDDTELMNHSCEPNVGIKGQIILIARRDIQENEELCFDYETTEIEPTPFTCNCGSQLCRKVLDGKAWKDPSFRERNHGYLSWYIEELILRETIDTPHLGTSSVLPISMLNRHPHGDLRA